MEISHFLGTVSQIHEEAQRRGLYFQQTTSERLADRTIELQGREVVSFSSCSYLGLEFHPALVEGVQRAVAQYGTQFSSSRGYVSAPPYRELEEKLSVLFGGHALVTPSTSLGHQAALTALLTEKDGIVLDHQVHYSVQMAARLAQANGASVALVKHGEPQRALEEVERLAKRCRTVWYAIDGVFSMYGDLAPLNLIHSVLKIGDNVRLYVDDAHGMSWAGKHGRGSFLSRLPLSDRMIVATSLNKAFAASGGALIFPSAEERHRVLSCGGPLVFSGPVQPPMLGAAIASADVHLSPEITRHQDQLRERTALCNRLMREHGMPLLVENEAPIFFVCMGLPKMAFAVAERMMQEGFFVNTSAYPSVPLKRAGIRFSVTTLHRIEDITAALSTMAAVIPEVMAQERITHQDLDALFAQAVPEEARVSVRVRPVKVTNFLNTEHAAPSPLVSTSAEIDPEALTVAMYRSIRAIDAAEWDAMLGSAGACSAAALRLAEDVFQGQERPEYNWEFYYIVVRDPAGKPIAASFFTTALNKDDMLMRDEVSQAVEERRRADPYFLTSRILSMGSGFSEGNHLYLDRTGPWRAALSKLLSAAEELYESSGANMLLLRDLPGKDLEMDLFLQERGLVKVPMFSSHHLDIDWADEEAYLASRTRRRRKQLREISEKADSFSVQTYGSRAGAALDPEALEHLYGLYRNVADRKLKLNVFPLPKSLLAAMQGSSAWEIVTLTLSPEAGGPADGRPVAWYAAHLHGEDYAPFLCGLDYRFVYDHGAYRCMILHMIRRARELGARRVHMGMDADAEKERFGSSAQANCVYLRAREHYNGAVLREIVAEVGLKGKSRR